MVVFDTTTVLAAIVPPEKVEVRVRGQLIADARERIDHLIEELEVSKTKVIIPTPALSEAFVRAGAQAAKEYLSRIIKASAFSIADFDTLAALEAAILVGQALDAGTTKKGGADGDWQKVKVDWQIVSIAKTRGATTIYSNDGDLQKLGLRAGIKVVGIEELPLRPRTPREPHLPLLERLENRGAKEFGD